MDLWTVGADIAQMATGGSVVTATWVWTRGRWRGRQERKSATNLRSWSGYIETGGINEWYVRLVEQPGAPTGRVVLDVVDRDGEPDVNRAHSMRQHILGDGQLARVPTPEEYAFLIALRKERGYGKGSPVR